MSALSALALLAASAFAQGAPDASYDARLTAVAGEVAVYSASDPSEPAQAESGMFLEEGDRVVVSSGSSAELSFDGKSLIDLNENADFTLTSLSRARAELSLAFGSLIAKIQKLGDDNLEVRTPAAVAAVRGTEFGVEAGSGGADAHVGVFDEGRVEVTGQAGMQVLTPNQETSVRRGGAPEAPHPLRRFLARRAAMRAALRRLAFVRAHWRRVSAARRRAMRRRAWARQRARWRARHVMRRRALNRRRAGRRAENRRGWRRRKENRFQ